MSSADRDGGSLPGVPSTPQGGHAATGVASSFAVEEFTGTASLRLPIVTSAPRELTPELALVYSSDGRNGPAGWGFSLALPSVSLYTGDGVPRYDGSDTYVLGSQPLVPLPEAPRQMTVEGTQYTVTRYASRTAAVQERIERWVRVPDGDTVWRHIDPTGLESLYGLDASARIADPANPRRVFEWLLQAQYDQRGEAISYAYLAENGANLPEQPLEAGRDRSAQRYLGFVRYAPQTAVTPPPYGIGAVPSVEWHAEVVFDYGQYKPDPSEPSPRPTGEWSARPDPFSRYEAGFEVRTYRLLANVMLLHRFTSLGPEAVLGHLMRLTYAESPVASRLVRYDSIGCSGGQWAPLPPLELDYTPLELGGSPFAQIRSLGPGTLAGLDNPPDFTLLDVDGEGVPSALYADGQTVQLRAPQNSAEPAYGRVEAVQGFPVQRTVDGGDARLLDMTGDGLLDMLLSTPSQTGIYPGGEGGFQTFVPFTGSPSELTSPAGRVADLSNDGLPDLVVLANGRLRRYPGTGATGFADAEEVPAPAGAPPTLDGEKQALVLFADMLGGGAQDLVRISDGRVEAWPSLGYGSFGQPVQLGGAPSLGEEFDARRVLLADLDGTGVQDIVYVCSDRALVYVNQSGNSFAPPVEIPLPVTVGSPTQVAIADLQGTGTEMLVVTANTPETQHWACPLAGRTRPYLLNAMRNNLGAQAQVRYSTSSRFWLQDAQAGVQWLTMLPFPATVVAEVVQSDDISGCSETSTYNYRHGYWCPEDREYGFALVERCDAEAIEGGQDDRLPASAEQAAQAASSVAPRQTLTWRSLGMLPDPALEAAIRSEWFAGDPHEQLLGGPSIVWGGPVPADGETVRQAYASLRGRTLREEVYGPDGGPDAATPYRVTQTACEARYLAPREEGPYAAFATHERESLEYLYEREASDPALRQSANLDIDQYGQVLRSVTVAYPRRAGAEEESLWTAQQEAMLAVCDSFSYIDIDSEQVYRVGIPCEHSRAQLTGIAAPPADRCFSFEELVKLTHQAFAGEAGLTASTVEATRYLYYEADGVTPAPLGECGPQALLQVELRAAFGEAQIRALFAGVLEGSALDALLEQGHYVCEPASGLWWGLGTSETYLPASAFYRPASTTDPCGALTTYVYDETTVAMIEAVQSAEGTLKRSVSVEAFDYLALVALATRDVNDSVAEVALDPLAQVVLSSYRGSELGEPVGFEAIVGREHPLPPSAAALIDDPDAYLEGAAQVVYYDLLCWAGQVTVERLEPLGLDSQALLAALAAAGYVTPEGVLLEAFRLLPDAEAMALPQPFAAHAQAIYALLAALPSGQPAHWVLAKARDYPNRAPEAPQVSLDYIDGFGRVVQHKQQASPSAGKEGWATSGAVRYNSRGLVYARCEPFFSDSWAFTAEALSERLGAATLTTYDPLDRPVRVERQEGFFAAFSIGAWTLVQADEVDTVLQSRYWREHSQGQGIGPRELQALHQAAALAETPVTFQLDPLGNAVARVDLLKGAAGEAPGAVQTLVTRYGSDVLGRQIWSADPRLVAGGEEAKSFQTTYGLTGQILLALSADAGERLRLPDSSGQELFVRDGRGLQISTAYDTLGRPSTVSVASGSGEAQIVEAYVYGDQLVEGKPIVSNPAGWNLIGEVYRLFDLAGMRQIDGYSLGGQPMVVAQRYLAEPAAQPDWTPAEATPSSPLLASEAWQSSRVYDALGLLSSMTDPVGSVYTWAYNELGFVAGIEMALAGGHPVAYLSSAQYNAQGQRTQVVYGNGVVVSFGYDPLSFRLVSAVARQGAEGQAIQDIGYVYDPVGNLVFSEDAAFNELFGDAVPPLQRSFVYDSLYRMVGACGLECSGYTAAMERQAGYEGLTVATEDGKLPAGSVVAGTRTQAYDAAGNLYWTERAAGGSVWSTEAVLSDTSNRGVACTLLDLLPAPPGGVPPERTLPAAQIDRFFDGDGNQTIVEQMPSVSWDYADRLSAASVSLGEGGDGSLVRSHDAVNQLMRELQSTPASGGTQTLDVLYLDTLEVARTIAPEGASTSGLRIQVKDGENQVAEARVEGEQTSVAYSLTDPAGSVAVRLGEDGRMLSYEVYTPYGATAFAVLPDASEAQDKLVRYDGHERDRLSGTYIFERRDFAPWLGRWLSPDPTGPVDGLNLFAFAGGNPSSNTDVGGRVKLQIDKNTTIDITPEEILKAIEDAALKLQEEAKTSPMTPTGTERKMDLYEANKRGDLLKLAYTATVRGDPIEGIAVAAYALRFGTLDVTEKGLGNEKGVHGTVIVGNEHRESKEMFGYDEIGPTENEQAEAKRLIHLFKVKTVPTGSDVNDSIVPVMAISETDRSVVGGLLALVELYNIKYGLRTFNKAFVNENEPFFIGAEKDGGAKALKSIDRVRRKVIMKPSQRMTRARRKQLDNSLETFVLGLHQHRGVGRVSKFAKMKTSNEVTAEITRLMRKRARFSEHVEEVKARRKAAIEAKRKLAAMK
ncbi:MAG: SpvB/TcaC N-terminal domain-containing protein [Solirubrobacteraceae bacterium]